MACLIFFITFIIQISSFSIQSQTTSNPYKNWQSHLRALKGQDWTAADYFRAGDLQERLGYPDKAYYYWQIGLGLEADTAVALKVVDVAIKMGDFVEAKDLLEGLWAQGVAHQNIALPLAYLEMVTDPLKAQEYLRSSQNNDPLTMSLLRLIDAKLSPEWHAYYTGLHFLDHEEYALAELSFAYANDLSYPFPEAMAYEGLTRLLNGKVGDALVKQALKLGPDKADVYYVQALVDRLEGRYLESLTGMEIAYTLAPNNPAYIAELGKACQLAGKLDLAERYYELALEKSAYDPQFAEILKQFQQETQSMIRLIESIP